MLCFSSLFSSVYATNDLEEYNTDNVSGWTLKNSKAHRGSKGYLYKYESDTVKEKYSSDFVSAIDMWGNRINMTETSLTGYGVFSVQNDSSSTAVATTSGLKYNDSIGHYYDSFTITINSARYDNKDSSLRTKALAHEIGHLYGLTHFSDTSKIMNPSLASTMSITTTDANGLNTCTHSHTHSDSTSYTYERYSNLRHKSRCSTCKAYKYENHLWGSNDTCSLCGREKD